MGKNICPKLTSVELGRTTFDISADLLEDLLGSRLSHTKIAKMLGGISLDYIKKDQSIRFR